MAVKWRILETYKDKLIFKYYDIELRKIILMYIVADAAEYLEYNGILIVIDKEMLMVYDKRMMKYVILNPFTMEGITTIKDMNVVDRYLMMTKVFLDFSKIKPREG